MPDFDYFQIDNMLIKEQMFADCKINTKRQTNLWSLKSPVNASFVKTRNLFSYVTHLWKE